MGGNALSIRAHGLGPNLLWSVALSFLMLPSGPAAAPQCANPPEIQGHGTTPKFRIRAERNLVIVPVVARDAKERTIRDLHKEDSRLFDAGTLTSAGKAQSDFIDRRVKPHEALLYLTPQPLCQVTGQKGAESQGVPNTFLDLTPAELVKRVPELKHLKSAKTQDMLPLILERVGATVANFFDNFSNTTCTEHVIFAIGSQGLERPQPYEAKFNYVAMVKPGTDKTRLQELRTDTKGEPAKLGGAVLTSGFVTLPAHFHPAHQRDSRFRYLGRELVKGLNTYVVAFAQQPGVARQAGRVAVGDKFGFVFEQGVAWIDPVSFRILRLRTDIQQPELTVGLQRETTEVEYSEVTFVQVGKTLWLPREVTVSGQLNQYIFYNQHHYSDYRLFTVQTEEKHKSP